MTDRVVLASGNSGKLRELRALLASCGLECVSQADYAVPPVVEDGLTFVENALKKARAAAEHAALPAIADDSGLEVPALGGRPGIYSARFAGEGAGDAANVARLLEEMRGLEGAVRSARFVCVVIYLRHARDPVPAVCTGIWKGQILEAPRGASGFGYDPVFLPEGMCESAAEIGAERKNALSHRARALQCLRRELEPA